MGKFDLGMIVITRNALDFCIEHNINYLLYLVKHHNGEWGDLDASDKHLNDLAIDREERVFSSYDVTPNEKLWIITEWDRSETCILLPYEY